MRFAYPRVQFLLRVGMFVAMLTTLLLFLSIPDTSTAWMLVIGAVGSAAVVIALTPALTCHEISDTGIILRQGVLFRAAIPFSDILSVESIRMRLWAFGMFPAAETRGRIVLASGARNLVSVKLRQKRRFGQLLWRSSDEMIIDLSEPERFVKAANENLKR